MTTYERRFSLTGGILTEKIYCCPHCAAPCRVVLVKAPDGEQYSAIPVGMRVCECCGTDDYVECHPETCEADCEMREEFDYIFYEED